MRLDISAVKISLEHIAAAAHRANLLCHAAGTLLLVAAMRKRKIEFALLLRSASARLLFLRAKLRHPQVRITL
jgi:hypothetical protein